MTVTTSVSLSTSVTRTLTDQSSKLSAILNNSSSAAPVAKSADVSASAKDSAPVVDDSLALRVDSVNIALTSTKLDVLDSGATQVLRILGQLQSLATRATLTGISDSEREVIQGQFQALRIAINNVPPAPPGSEYTASSLLGGVAADLPEADAKAVVGGFNDVKLLGDSNVASEAAAKAASQTIGDAIAKIAAQRVTIGNLKDTTDFAAASVDAALANQEAAKANFAEFEILPPTLAYTLELQPGKSADVQTAKLPSNILQLLNS